MLLHKIVMEYSIACDNCGKEAGFDRDRDDAKWQAWETGYVYYEYTFNGKDYHRDFCPECNRKLPESERRRMGREQPAPMLKPEPGVWL